MTGVNAEVEKATAKAMELVRAGQLEKRLWRLFHTVKHYGAWSKRGDFEERWNIGLRNITATTEEIDFGWKKEEFDIVHFDAFDLRISVGGKRIYSETPDGDYAYWCILYRADGSNSLLAQYGDADDLPDYCPNMTGVEEFHYDKTAFEVLERLNQLIDEYKEKCDRRDAEERKNRYAGKFTF